MGVLDQLIVAVAQLSDPPEAVYGDVGTAAPGATASDAAPFLARVAVQLRTLAGLLRSVEAAQLGLQAWFEDDTAPPSGADAASQRMRGLVIEEISDDAARSAAASEACVRLLLAVAQYSAEMPKRVGDEQGQQQAAAAVDGPPARPWAAPPASDAAAEVLQALAAQFASVAALKPTSLEQQERAQCQALLAAALPELLYKQLRPVVMALRLHDSSDQSRLEPYTGPDAFARGLAAGQLRWLLTALDEPAALARVVRPALPYVLACVDDSSPEVQAQGLWTLRHLAVTAVPADLAWQQELLLDVARRCLVGCADAAWPAATAAATALALKLECGSNGGGSPNAGGSTAACATAAHSAAYAAVLEALVEEGDRSGHVAARARIWLRHAPRLFPPLGLQLARYFARLLPLLLRWCRGGGQVAAPALRALHTVILQTWPRMPAHGRATWPVLAAAYADAAASTSAGDSAEGAGDDVGEWAAQCGTALWHCGGVDLQHSLLVSSSAAQQQLLEAVMERVEAEEQAAAGGREPAEERSQEEQERWAAVLQTA